MPCPRNICFTYNHPVEGPQTIIKKYTDLRQARYMVFQLEEGANGNQHYQGYIELNNSMRITTLKNKFIYGAHYEQRRGSRNQARDYCMKEESRLDGPWEVGEWSTVGQGRRTDINNMIDACRTGSIRLLAEEQPLALLRYPRGATLLCSLNAQGRPEPPEVILLYGVTGCGKTRFAVDSYGPLGPKLFRKPPDVKWFDGYIDQDLLLDDFTGAASKLSLSYLLQLLDRYDITVEIKGGYVPLMAKHIIITTNCHPSTWYKYEGRTMQYYALRRRIHHIYCFAQLSGIFEADREKFFGQLTEHAPSEFAQHTNTTCKYVEEPIGLFQTMIDNFNV